MGSVKSSGNWLRANLIGEFCLNEALEAVLHNDQGDLTYTGLPRDEKRLQIEMIKFKNSADGRNLTRKKVLRPNQWNILCPPYGKSKSRDWDITIKKVVIQYKTNLPEPIGGWRIDVPSLLDVTKAAFTVRAKNLRNQLKHGTVKEMSVSKTYDNVIARMEYILKGLDYQNMAVFEHLKTCSLEENTEKMVNIVKKDLENEILILKDGLTETTKTANDLKDGLRETTKTANENKQDILVQNSQIQKLRSDTFVLKDIFHKFQAGLSASKTTLQHRLQTKLDRRNKSIDGLVREIEKLRRVAEANTKKIEEVDNRVKQNIHNVDNRVRSAAMEKNSYQMQHLVKTLPNLNKDLLRESVNHPVSERTISCHASSDMHSVRSIDLEENRTGYDETTTLAREQLAMSNQRIGETQRKQTSSRTRDEIRRKEALLAKLEKEGPTTTSRTRERMADLDRRIAEAERKKLSRTRQQLKEKEERLRRMREESASSF